jgi:hypothetical protein
MKITRNAKTRAIDMIGAGLAAFSNWLRGWDLNPGPSGYEPDELPDCSTPRSEPA